MPLGAGAAPPPSQSIAAAEGRGERCPPKRGAGCSCPQNPGLAVPPDLGLAVPVPQNPGLAVPVPPNPGLAVPAHPRLSTAKRKHRPVWDGRSAGRARALCAVPVVVHVRPSLSSPVSRTPAVPPCGISRSLFAVFVVKEGEKLDG